MTAAPPGSAQDSATPGRPVVDPAGWRAAELAASDDWIYRLDDGALADLRRLVTDIRRRIGDNVDALLGFNRADFPLGRTADFVRDIDRTLREGYGLALLRGLPVAEMDALDTAITYWALGSHIGVATSNNPQGDMIGHVIDLGKDIRHPRHRGYQTRALLDYHTDQANVVALLCLQQARSGGRSKVVSAITVYNEILARRPDLVDVLMQPFCFSMMGEVDPDEPDFYESPVFTFRDGRLSTSFGASHIIKGHELPETPDLSPLQREAIDLVQVVSEELHFAMLMEPGDIQFLNNMTALHARDAYEDWPEPDRRRHLWRLWLTVDGIRPLTPFQEHWRRGLMLASTRGRINLGTGT
jgi:hypothetical protein